VANQLPVGVPQYESLAEASPVRCRNDEVRVRRLGAPSDGIVDRTIPGWVLEVADCHQNMMDLLGHDPLLVRTPGGELTLVNLRQRGIVESA
jgi:hypothetical protein